VPQHKDFHIHLFAACLSLSWHLAINLSRRASGNACPCCVELSVIMEDDWRPDPFIQGTPVVLCCQAKEQEQPYCETCWYFMGCQRKHSRHISLGSLLLSRRTLISGCLQPMQLSWLPVLSSVAPPSLCRNAATDNMLQIIEAHPNWPLYADIFEHPRPRLASRRSVLSDMTSVDTITQWR